MKLPKAHEVHLWYISADSLADLDKRRHVMSFLSDSERAQLDRFCLLNDQLQFMAARYLVRSVLSLYAPLIPPREWGFNVNRHGKPSPSHPLSPRGLNFNLSHSGGMVVCAIAADPEVGVDVEKLEARVPCLEVAKQTFSATEFEEMKALPPEVMKRRFFEYWTLKESYVKARGIGLTLALELFSFVLKNGSIRVLFDTQLDDRASSWAFRLLSPTSMHQVAVALRSPGPISIVEHSYVL